MKIKLTFLCFLLPLAGLTAAERDAAGNLSSAVVTQDKAARIAYPGSIFYNYFQGETVGTTNALTGVAVIEPGHEIHPPHKHAEEEYLMIIEGEGRWVLNGREFAAKAGDILYAAPWDLHGIFNTGSKPLKFVVFKWSSKGVPIPPETK